MSRTPKRLQLMRRLVGLPADAPDPSGFVFKKDEKSGFYTHDKLPVDEEISARDAWHAEGWRGRLTNAAYQFSPARYLRNFFRAIKYKLLDRLTSRALSKARSINVTSHYIHRTDCDEVELYFDLGKNKHYFVIVYTRKVANEYILSEFDFMNKYRRDLGQKRSIITQDDLMLFPEHMDWIVVDEDELNDEIIAAALSEWYQDKYSFEQGHWSQVEKKLPAFLVDLEWRTPSEDLE